MLHLQKCIPIANPNQSKNIDLVSIGILAALCLVWGSSFILIKKSLLAFSPVQLACFRIGIAGLAFSPFLINEFRKIKKKDYPYLLVVSLCGSGIPAYLYAVAQTNVSSSVAGLLNSMTPLFTLLLGYFFFRTRIDSSKVGGVLIGFVGVSLLLLFGKEAGVGDKLLYPMLIVIATIGYGTSVNTVGKFLKDYSAITISSVAFGIITIPAILILLSTNIFEVFETSDKAWSSLMYVSILSFFGTFLANIFFYKLVQRTSPLFSSTVSYLIPLVALAWGYFDGEVIGLYHILGFVLILSGVYLTRGKQEYNVSKES